MTGNVGGGIELDGVEFGDAVAGGLGGNFLKCGTTAVPRGFGIGRGLYEIVDTLPLDAAAVLEYQVLFSVADTDLQGRGGEAGVVPDRRVETEGVFE